MAAVIDAVLTALETAQAVTGKTYHAEALKNAQAPFLFWLQDAEECTRSLSGNTGIWEDSYEIHCVAKNLDTLNKQAAAMRDAVEGLQGQTINGILYESVNARMSSPTLREVEVGLYRKVYAITINYQYIEVN